MPEALRRAARLVQALAAQLWRDLLFERADAATAGRAFADTVADEPRDARDTRADFMSMG